jgi:hypothetical protein
MFIKSTVFNFSFLRDRPTSLNLHGCLLNKAEIHHHVNVSNIHWSDSFHSCESDRQVWIFMCACAHWIRWNTLPWLPCHRFKYPLNRQFSFLRDRPTSLNLHGCLCSLNTLKYITMSLFQISIESTDLIPARQTDKSESPWVLVFTESAEIHYHVIVSIIHQIASFHSCEIDRPVRGLAQHRTHTFSIYISSSLPVRLRFSKWTRASIRAENTPHTDIGFTVQLYVCVPEW